MTWAAQLTGAVAAPVWRGPARAFRLLSAGDDIEPEPKPAPRIAPPAAPAQPTRCCSRCGTNYPESREFFFASKGGRGGLRPECKACNRERPCVQAAALRRSERQKLQRKAAQPAPPPLLVIERGDCAAILLDLEPPRAWPWPRLVPGSEIEQRALQLVAEPWPFPA